MYTHVEVKIMQPQLDIETLIAGYTQTPTSFKCHYCQQTFPLSAGVTAIQDHLTEVHGGAQQALITQAANNKLTGRQQELLTAFASGASDKVVADALELSPSTVRHQKFTFREKAKQAALYLAQYEAVFGRDDPTNTYLTLPSKVSRDDRMVITEAEYQRYVNQYATTATGQFRLKLLPKGQKKLVGLMHRIIEEFEFNRHYTHQEIDQKLQAIYPDFSLLRRELVDYGFLDRTNDGRDYWRIF